MRATPKSPHSGSMALFPNHMFQLRCRYHNRKPVHHVYGIGSSFHGFRRWRLVRYSRRQIFLLFLCCIPDSAAHARDLSFLTTLQPKLQTEFHQEPHETDLPYSRGRRSFRRGRHMAIDSVANMNITLESTMNAARSPTTPISKSLKGRSKSKLKPAF